MGSSINNNISEAAGKTPSFKRKLIYQGNDAEIYTGHKLENDRFIVNDVRELSMIETASDNYKENNALHSPETDSRFIFLLSDEVYEKKINLLRAFNTEIVVLPSSGIPDNSRPENYGQSVDSYDTAPLRLLN